MLPTWPAKRRPRSGRRERINPGIYKNEQEGLRQEKIRFSARKRSFSFGDPGNLYKGRGGKTRETQLETVVARVARRE